MLLHCLCPTNKIKAKTLLLLTEVSPLHMSLFGHTFLSILYKKLSLVNILNVCSTWKLKGDLSDGNNNFDLSEDDFMLLLPTALSYLKSNLDNYSKQDLKLLGTIPVFYTTILLTGFSYWKSCLRTIFEEEYHESAPISFDDFEILFRSSLLWQLLCCITFSS